MNHVRQEGEANQRRKTERDIDDRVTGHAVHFIDHILHFTGNRFRPGQQYLTGIGQGDAGIFTDHQFGAKIGFNVIDDLTHCRLS